MPRPDGRISAGDPLSEAVSARAWNRAQDAADLVLRVGSTSADRTFYSAAPYTAILAKNSSGAAVPRWGLMSITGMAVTPSTIEAAAQFQSIPVVECGVAADTKLCVAIEPIKAGEIGRVAVDGVVQIKAADEGKAKGCAVLWKDTIWALIRMDVGVVRGSFEGPWRKSTTNTVLDQIDARGTTYTAKNYFADILTSETKACAIAYANGEWILIAAECD